MIIGFSPFDLGMPGEIAMDSKARCPFSILSGVGDEDKLVSFSDEEPTLLFFLMLPAVVLFAEVG